MFKLDDNLLKDLGLGDLPPQEKNKMLAHIYETLEMRVGMKLAEQMSNEQLDDFERFIDGDVSYARGYLDNNKAGWEQASEYQASLAKAQENAAKRGVTLNTNAVISEFGALSWLETNFPNYKQVVGDELEKLKVEVKQAAPQVLALSRQAPSASPQGQPLTSQPQVNPQQVPPPAAEPPAAA